MTHRRRINAPSLIAPMVQIRVDPWSVIGRVELHWLNEKLLDKDPDAIENAVSFIESESRGLGHGRARALMCRRLKYCPVTASQRDRVVACVMERLRTGDFSQQFRDQLRLAIHLDPRRVSVLATDCTKVPVDHVRRFADWTLARLVAKNSDG